MKVLNEDLAFKNNEVWISGGQNKEIAVWDYRNFLYFIEII
jgi:hypothetical protein